MLEKVSTKTLVIAIIVILAVGGLIGYKIFNPSISESFKSEIDSRITRLALSSNSTLKEGYLTSFNQDSEDFKYIVKHGRKSLKYLVERIENSKVDGTQEFIAATACSEILGSKGKNIEWSTGKEWVKKYKQ